jgi:hypothetical protein
MSIVRSDDKLVTECIEEMARLVVERGGMIHPAVCIEEQDGDIRVICRDLQAAGQQMFRVPNTLLVPIDDIEWTDSQDELELRQEPSHLSADQRRMLDLFMMLYNATGKMAEMKTKATRVVLRDSDFAAQIATVTHVNPNVAREPISAAEALMRTRFYANSKAPGDLAKARVLMPLVDFANHHHAGALFRQDAQSLSVDIAHPAQSDECFYSYAAFLDPLANALAHGFVDYNSPFGCSVPVKIDIAGFGRFEIAGKRALPSYTLDLPKVELAENGMTVSHLTGDVRKPHHFHKTLRLITSAFAKKRGLSDDSFTMAHAELRQTLLIANRQRLTAFSAYMRNRRDLPIGPVLASAGEYQLANLERILSHDSPLV